MCCIVCTVVKIWYVSKEFKLARYFDTNCYMSFVYCECVFMYGSISGLNVYIFTNMYGNLFYQIKFINGY